MFPAGCGISSKILDSDQLIVFPRAQHFDWLNVQQASLGNKVSSRRHPKDHVHSSPITSIPALILLVLEESKTVHQAPAHNHPYVKSFTSSIERWSCSSLPLFPLRSPDSPITIQASDF